MSLYEATFLHSLQELKEISLFDAKRTVVAKSSALPKLNLVIKFAVVGKTITKSAHLESVI